MTNLSIVNLSPHHTEELFEILKRVYESQSSQLPMGGAWTRSLLRSELVSGKGLAAADASGHLWGFVLYRESGEGFEVSLLATCPHRRKRGCMNQLLSELKARLKASQHLWVDVHEKNIPAKALYSKQGFSQAGLRKNYYRDGGAAELYSWSASSELNPCPY